MSETMKPCATCGDTGLRDGSGSAADLPCPDCTTEQSREFWQWFEASRRSLEQRIGDEISKWGIGVRKRVRALSPAPSVTAQREAEPAPEISEELRLLRELEQRVRRFQVWPHITAQLDALRAGRKEK